MKEPETVFHQGIKSSPLALFIHGMGMNVSAWTDPARARILGGKYPLTALLSDKSQDLETSFHDIRGLGWHLLSWSQTRPAGPIRVAVQELKDIIARYQRYSGSGIVFVCHSRGGLIARKYLETDSSLLRALITLSSPHHGTSLARWATMLAPLASGMDQVLKGSGVKEAESAFRRILMFIGSSGVRELLPASGFLSGLTDLKKESAFYLSLGGTRPDILRAVSPSFQKRLSAKMSQRFLPDEMKSGLGDGLVTAASSVLSYGDIHRNFPVNHAEILFDRKVREYILNVLLA